MSPFNRAARRSNPVALVAPDTFAPAGQADDLRLARSHRKRQSVQARRARDCGSIFDERSM